MNEIAMAQTPDMASASTRQQAATATTFPSPFYRNLNTSRANTAIMDQSVNAFMTSVDH